MQLRNRHYDYSSQKVIEPKTCSQKTQKKLVDLVKANVRREMVTCTQKKVKYYETKTKSKTSRNTSSVQDTEQIQDNEFKEFVKKAIKILNIVYYYDRKKGYRLNFAIELITLLHKFEINYYFVEKYTSTMEEKMDTSVSIKKLYTYVNKEQLRISYFQDQKDYKFLYQLFIRELTKAAKEFEKKMNDLYEKETQKTLTRSMKKQLSNFKALLEETKTELHKWCEYSEKC